MDKNKVSFSEIGIFFEFSGILKVFLFDNINYKAKVGTAYFIGRISIIWNINRYHDIYE